MPQWVLRGEGFRSRFRGDIRALSDGISGYRTPRSARSSSWSVRRSGRRSGRRGACLHTPISSTGPAQSHRAVSEGQRNSRVEVRHQNATLRDRNDGDNAYETAKHGRPSGETVGIEAGGQPGLSLIHPVDSGFQRHEIADSLGQGSSARTGNARSPVGQFSGAVETPKRAPRMQGRAESPQ